MELSASNGLILCFSSPYLPVLQPVSYASPSSPIDSPFPFFGRWVMLPEHPPPFPVSLCLALQGWREGRSREEATHFKQGGKVEAGLS